MWEQEAHVRGLLGAETKGNRDDERYKLNSAHKMQNNEHKT